MIDDIQYLKNNSINDSIIVYTDSGKRQKQFFPDPAHYEVSFDQPLKYVYGIDILDASIPNTMYNIDKYHNDFYLTTVNIPNDINALRSNQMEPIYFSELCKCESYIDLYNNKEQSYIIVTNSNVFPDISLNLNTATTDSNNCYVYNRYIYPNINFETKHNQSYTEYMFFNYQNTDYAVKIHNNDEIINIINTNEYCYSNNSLIYFTNTKIDNTTYSNISNSNNYYIIANTNHLALDVGNYDILSILSAINNLLLPFDIDASPTIIPARQ